VRDFYLSSRYAEHRTDPDICDFTFGNPQELPLEGIVAAMGGKLKVSTPDGTVKLSDHWAAVFIRVQGTWKIRMMTVGEDANILPMRR
jgi:hypothetical protein